jgi:hypothetical protein
MAARNLASVPGSIVSPAELTAVLLVAAAGRGCSFGGVGAAVSCAPEASPARPLFATGAGASFVLNGRRVSIGANVSTAQPANASVAPPKTHLLSRIVPSQRPQKPVSYKRGLSVA